MKTPEEMTLAELEQFVLESVNEQGAEPTRDVATELEAKKEEAEEVIEEVYRKVIDLGDGSGVQVFEAPTLDELVDKLAAAQTNATKKIREQAQLLKDKATAEEKPMTESEKWLLQQRMISEPDKVIGEVIEKQFKEKYGSRIEKLEASEKVQAGEQTAQQWVEATTDYYASPKNGERMKKYLATYQMDISPENLTKAFEDLNESGLLESRPKETNANTEVVQEPTERIVKPAETTVVRRKVVGGISTKRSAPVEKTAPGLTEADLYKMPLSELENLTYQALR